MNLYAPNLISFSGNLANSFGMAYGRSRVNPALRVSWGCVDDYVLVFAIKRLSGNSITVYNLDIQRYYALQPSFTLA